MIFQDLKSTFTLSPLPPGETSKIRRLPETLIHRGSETVSLLESGAENPFARQQLDIFKGSWNNFELYIEYCAKPGSYNLQAMGKRATTMDYSELLELLKSLNLMPERDGFFAPGSKIPQALLHDVFEAVNFHLFKQFHVSGGKSGDRDKIEMVFDEYKMLMLTLAACLRLDMDALLKGSEHESDAAYKKSIFSIARCVEAYVSHIFCASERTISKRIKAAVTFVLSFQCSSVCAWV
jgi:hypothetical protein